MSGNGNVIVQFGRPFVPEAGEHDIGIMDVRVRDARYGKVLLVDFIILNGDHKGKTFPVLFGIPQRISEYSKLGQFLIQMGFPVMEWAVKGAEIDIYKLLVGKRIRAVIGVVAKEGRMGTYTVATIAAVKRVYREGEGPSMPEEEVPF